MARSFDKGWFIALTGDGQDLQELCRKYPDCTQFEGRIGLLLDAGRPIETHKVARDEATKIVQRLNGLAHLTSAGWNPFGLSDVVVEIDADGRGRHRTIHLLGVTERLRLRDSMSVEVLDASGQLVPCPAESDRGAREAALFNLPNVDPDVANICDLFSGSISWRELYTILEIITGRCGKQQAYDRGWLSPKDHKSFGLTANHYGTLGADSRHGPRSGWKAPELAMSLADATTMIARLAHLWFQHLVSQGVDAATDTGSIRYT